MWPKGTYFLRPRWPRRRLKHTPPPGPSRGLPEHQPREHASPSVFSSMQLNVVHQKNLQKSHINEDSKSMNSLAQKESMTDDDLQGESNPNNTQISSGITSSSNISSSLLRSSDMNFHIETTSFEDSLSSFPSPEIFRGGKFLDISDSTSEDYLKFKNSTFLDTSRAVAIENMQQFSNLSPILDNSIYKILPETEKTPYVKTKPQCITSKMCYSIKSSPRNRCTKIPCCCPGGASKDMVKKQVDKEKLKTKKVVDTMEGTSNQWREEVSCTTNELFCIVKASPRNKSMKTPCCPSKRVPEDIIMAFECVGQAFLCHSRLEYEEKSGFTWK
ncbi:LOW QUALITY PROTEIN: meiosis-specific kinetochore protein-like [Petaurus breviceps papuanus]|uniref:LOW QUALITY PROTEIN: meiosis-specific kinetochore protein-like n=1 Tax=Petaurus breviceps papuanus TaxID=3040969 RepID=UPI0036D793AE